MIKKLWNFMDGKKTLSGIAITLAGIGMIWTPAVAYAPETIIIGITTTVGGFGHKIYKKKKSTKE